MEKVSTEELHTLVGQIEGMVTDDIADALNQLLALPDDQFEILAGGILQSYQQTLNNPNERIALMQVINSQNANVEDVIDILQEITTEIDNLELSRVKRDFLKQAIGAISNAINETNGIAKRNINVAIELCHPDAKIPQYAHISDSGLDVYALEDITINPGETRLIPTGIKVALPPGYELQVRAKSGRASRTKLRLGNGIGTIDQEYRDEIKIIMENIEPRIKDITVDPEGHVTSILFGNSFTIGKGEKFCQLVLAETPKVSWTRVDSILEFDKSDRGGGFGSSGLK